MAERPRADSTWPPQRVIERLDLVVLSGWPEAGDRRPGDGTIQHVARVATLVGQLPTPAVETVDALGGRMLAHDAHDRA